MILKPLCKPDGTESDHSIISASFKLPKKNKAVASSFTFRPITTKGNDTFKQYMVQHDWSELTSFTCASKAADELNKILQHYFELSFEEKTRKIRSTDPPWLDGPTKRLIRKKRCIYRAEGKSIRYEIAAEECQAAINLRKKRFLDNITAQIKDPKDRKAYYRAVNMLKTKEFAIPWDITNLFPDSTEPEIAEMVAEFFNQISQEYVPLPNPIQASTNTKYLEEFQVSAKTQNL